MLKKAINLFYKLAISDYPDWIPQEHKRKLERIKSIEKDPRLKDFRVLLDNTILPDESLIPTGYENSMITAILVEINAIRYMYNIIINKYHIRSNANKIKEGCYEEIYKKTMKALDDTRAIYNVLSDINKIIECLRNNEIQIGHGKPKFSKFYNNIVNEHNKLRTFVYSIYKEIADENMLNLKIKKFEQLPGHEAWVNRVEEKNPNKGQEIVFTTKNKDILGMSSRSDWNSCQDLRPGSAWLDKMDNLGTIGSCVSKNIGIIYITDGSDFEGRGERIIYRSVVWIVKSLETNNDVLFVQKAYTIDSEVIKGIFKKILESQLGMAVTTSEYDLIKYEEEYQHPAYDDAHLGTINYDFIICFNCGERAIRKDTHILLNGDVYCNKCYLDKIINCSGCNNNFIKEETQNINNNNYCKDCIKKQNNEGINMSTIIL